MGLLFNDFGSEVYKLVILRLNSAKQNAEILLINVNHPVYIA